MRGVVKSPNWGEDNPNSYCGKQEKSFEEEELTKLQRSRKSEKKRDFSKKEKDFQERYVDRGRRTIAVDLDDTIAEVRRSEARDRAPVLAGLKDGAREFLEWARGEGYYILIFTARLNTCWENQDFAEIHYTILEFLLDNDLPFDEIWTKPGKPFARWYVDDSAIRFEGDWTKVKWQIQNEACYNRGSF